MDLKQRCADLLAQALRAVDPGLAQTAVVLERPKQAAHGDFSCNAAMQAAKTLKRPPRELAQAIIAALPASAEIERAEIAGPGFINLFVRPAAKLAALERVFAEGAAYGGSKLGAGARVQIEFVSANPTGPLHVGHGRGAAYGASLANVLAACGYAVEREFYVNDAGRQMDILAVSVWLRYLEANGVAVTFPDDGYRGDYVRDIAANLAKAHGASFVREAAAVAAVPVPDNANEDADADAALDALIAHAKALLGESWHAIHQAALDAMLADQRDDLAGFGVSYDRWYSEQSLYDSGAVARAMAELETRGHLYEKDGALWFRSTDFGDEKDRVVRRDNGQFTYFASDIAYHADKFARGYGRVIDVWGADHHGYIARVKGALTALGLDPEHLTVALVQFAALFRNGEKVAMGKRSGEFVTLRDLRGEIGNDAARFFYVLRKSDQHLDFDLDLAKSQSNENPVYYVQYAHARIGSVLAQWGSDPASLAAADISPLTLPAEADLVQRLAEYPEIVAVAAQELAPHTIAFYLRELAADLHSYYNATRLLADEEPVKRARLKLVLGVRQVLANGLALLGVSAPERM
ncbi:MAG: arginine--tRNA ligase [Burkholderiales bacterium]